MLTICKPILITKNVDTPPVLTITGGIHIITLAILTLNVMHKVEHRMAESQEPLK